MSASASVRLAPARLPALAVLTVEPPSVVQAALSASPQPELRHVRAEESDTSVILTGRVSSFYHKQMAQETAKAVSRLRVVNLVQVND